LRKIWGPRVPRLLEVMKWRCLSTICPLTPQLLRKWIDSPTASSARRPTRGHFTGFRLSMEAYVRLIAALDKSIPCWLETNHEARHVDDSARQLDPRNPRLSDCAHGTMKTSAHGFDATNHRPQERPVWKRFRSLAQTSSANMPPSDRPEFAQSSRTSFPRK